MGGRASRGWWWVAGLLGGCQPYVGGAGTGGPNTLGLPDDAGDATSAGTEDGTPSTGEAATSPDPSGDPSGPEPTTAGPADDSTTGEPATTTNGGQASLSLSDGPVYDFGDVPAGGQASHVFTLTNGGDAEAIGLAGMVPPPFDFSGAFPGSAGTCGASLGAGESCTIEVVFSSAQLGRYAGTLSVSHDGGSAAARDVVGGVAGQTANLLVNAGGEEGGTPPTGWIAAEGAWIAASVPTEVGPFEGAAYLYADTGSNNVDFSLQQDVDVGGWASTIDQGVLRISFSGQAQGYWNGNGDEHRIRVHYLDGGGSALQVFTTDYQNVVTWTERADSRLAPAGTRTVRVELNCRKNSGTWCNAYFDALDLHASYP